MGKNPFPVFRFNLKVPYSLGVFRGGAVVKNPPANAGEAGDWVQPPVGKIPGRRKWQPIFLPEKFHGQRSLVGSSPWGHKESDTTE